MQTTFTVLVTLTHDENQGHSPSRIAEIVQVALEEGTSVSGGFLSAQADAFKGDCTDARKLPKGSRASQLHRDFHAA